MPLDEQEIAETWIPKASFRVRQGAGIPRRHHQRPPVLRREDGLMRSLGLLAPLPLNVAVSITHGDMSALDAMLDADDTMDSIDSVDSLGRTPLMLAIVSGQQRIALSLIE